MHHTVIHQHCGANRNSGKDSLLDSRVLNGLAMAARPKMRCSVYRIELHERYEQVDRVTWSEVVDWRAKKPFIILMAMLGLTPTPGVG